MGASFERILSIKSSKTNFFVWAKYLLCLFACGCVFEYCCCCCWAFQAHLLVNNVRWHLHAGTNAWFGIFAPDFSKRSQSMPIEGQQMLLLLKLHLWKTVNLLKHFIGNFLLFGTYFLRFFVVEPLFINCIWLLLLSLLFEKRKATFFMKNLYCLKGAVIGNGDELCKNHDTKNEEKN